MAASRFEKCVPDVIVTILNELMSQPLIEVPSFELNISVYIIDINSLIFPFVVILQTMSYVLFCLFFIL